MNKRLLLSLGVSTLLLAALATTFLADGSTAWAAKNTSLAQISPYTVVQKPTISASFINSVLAYYSSPAKGKGQALYDLGQRYGIDPVFALAFFRHESLFGSKGIATGNKSLGNIRCYQPTSTYVCYNGFRRYKTWEAGFEDWYKLIGTLYVKSWHLTTVDQIVPRYAPSGDGNNPTGYINAVKQSVDTWRSDSKKAGQAAAKARSTPKISPYTVVQKPSISASLINKVLAYYSSPAKGKGQALYDLGQRYGIDPAFALAFFRHESLFGSKGIATGNKSLGNIRCYQPTSTYVCYNGFRRYKTWEVGFEDWYKLINAQYVKVWHLTTVDQIIPRYAPSSDGNNPTGYINAVKQYIDAWRHNRIN